jgi:hypothetical protein
MEDNSQTSFPQLRHRQQCNKYLALSPPYPGCPPAGAENSVSHASDTCFQRIDPPLSEGVFFNNLRSFPGRSGRRGNERRAHNGGRRDLDAGGTETTGLLANAEHSISEFPELRVSEFPEFRVSGEFPQSGNLFPAVKPHPPGVQGRPGPGCRPRAPRARRPRPGRAEKPARKTAPEPGRRTE